MQIRNWKVIRVEKNKTKLISGEIYKSYKFKNGSYIITSPILKININTLTVYTRNSVYKLESPSCNKEELYLIDEIDIKKYLYIEWQRFYFPIYICNNSARLFIELPKDVDNFFNSLVRDVNGLACSKDKLNLTKVGYLNSYKVKTVIQYIKTFHSEVELVSLLSSLYKKGINCYEFELIKHLKIK